MAPQFPPTHPGTPECAKVEDLLKEVSDELTDFQAKNLDELKKSLEAIVGKKKTADDEYRKEFEKLRGRWCKHQERIEELAQTLKCSFPEGEWRRILRECLCKFRAKEQRLAERVRKRAKCCRGRRERERDETKERLADVKARLDVLMGLAAAIAKQLDANDALIKEVSDLSTNGGKHEALFVFFGKLLPQHIALRPQDISPSCATFGDDDTPEKICDGYECPEPPCDDSACDEKPDDTPTKPCPPRRTMPWILLPDDLAGEVDCAAEDYRKARNEAAAAEAAYKKKPDDLESLRKELSDARAKLEEWVRKCLKDKKPEDKCCTQPPPEKCPPQHEKYPPQHEKYPPNRQGY